MSNFKFRLATLVRLREQTRDERRAALAEAYRVDELLRQQVEVAQNELERLKNHCREVVGPGRVDVDHLVEAQRYEIAIRAQQAQLVRQRETVAVELQRRRQALIEADREVRILEKLREKLADEHRREEERRDSRRLDEVGQQQAMREAVQ